MSIGGIFFAVFSLVSVLGALATVLSRSPIRSAVGLLATIGGIAGLFLQLDAQFLATIQLIVYAGAVVVLFVFVIMLLGPDASDSATRGAAPRPVLSRVVAGGLFLLLALLGAHFVSHSGLPSTPMGPVPAGHGGVAAIGQALFVKELVPFELTTVLLIVAVVGAIAVARSKPVLRVEKADTNPTRRLFHGPVHPRDAGRPLPKGGVL